MSVLSAAIKLFKKNCNLLAVNPRGDKYQKLIKDNPDKIVKINYSPKTSKKFSETLVPPSV